MLKSIYITKQILYVSNIIHRHMKMNYTIKLSSVFSVLMKNITQQSQKGWEKGLEEDTLKIHWYKKSVR